MRQTRALSAVLLLLASLCTEPPARSYDVGRTVPHAGGCPQPIRWNISSAAPLNRRWSTSLPGPQAFLTVASSGTSAQLDEVEAVIEQSYSVWSGVTGTTVNTVTDPGVLAPLERTNNQNACSNDQGTNADGLNTICFNQSSSAFTVGVLAFTRLIIADAPGVTVGSSGPSSFAGQILDADILFRNDGQSTIASPGALATLQGQGAYDLESLLLHELGHFLGLEEAGVWRGVMFPFAPPPGTFLGDRPTAQIPDAPLADDDRAGIRSLYSDPADMINVGAIRGRILPANPFALATQPPPSAGQSVTGIFGTQIIAVDDITGEVVAAALGGWTCDPANPPTSFDGSFQIERLPVGRSYKIYVEPFDGLASPGTIESGISGLCRSNVTPPCTTPVVNTNFTAHVRPASP